MQQLWIRIVQFYLTVGIKFYYKKFDVVYLEKIPKDKAVIYLSNHQNALLDPLLITIKSTRGKFFLTKAAVFKNPIVAKILNSFQMLPIYRIIDGVDTVQKNKEIFTFCSKLLSKKKSIILFPEGSHNLKRKVRPLKKGFLRIIEETLQTYPNTEIIIVPIGVNYQNPIEWGDSMSVYFGNHISANNYWTDNQLDFNKLSKDVTSNMKQLTTHIESIYEYDTSIEKLTNLHVDFTNPTEVNKCLQYDFTYTGKKVKSVSKFYPFFSFLVKAFYFIPYYVWRKKGIPKIKEDEFIATFRYAIILTVTPIYLLLLTLILTFVFGKIISLTVLGIGILLPIFTLRVK
ncbi:MAG: 1-acyl-sn-glycerol-3-phosphate acyltransferase [Flavobacteriaceae bacterium]|nr:1-acyl-sn-glycerol-3-phosphate acyltransferase [Flavobacteriaceae bacterium]